MHDEKWKMEHMLHVISPWRHTNVLVTLRLILILKYTFLFFFFFHKVANIILLMILSLLRRLRRFGYLVSVGKRMGVWGGGDLGGRGRLGGGGRRGGISVGVYWSELSSDSAVTSSWDSPFQSGMVVGKNDICLYCVLQDTMS